MSSKITALIASILTIVLSLAIALGMGFMSLVALNGFSERAATPGMATQLVCQGITIILGAVLAWWFANLFINRFQMQSWLAGLLAIFSATVLVGLLSFLALVIAVVVTSAAYR